VPLDLGSAVKLLQHEISDLIAIYLFGSHATDDAGPESDLDLAVLPGHPLEPVRRWHLQEEIARLLHTDVDLVDLLFASTVMRVQVIDGGRVLWEGQRSLREAFEARALGAYARLNLARAGILDDIKRLGTVHG